MKRKRKILHSPGKGSVPRWKIKRAVKKVWEETHGKKK